MFLHLCLLAVGLHVGRRLFDPQPPAPEREDGPERLTAGQPLPTGQPLSEEPSRVEADAAMRAEIHGQFDLALVCMGLTTATSLFMPQLRALGGLAVLYAGIPIMKRARELLFDERRVGAEVLDTVGMVSTLAARHYISSSFMFLLYAGSRKLRLMTERAAQESMVDAFGRRTDLVWVRRGDVEISVPLASLQIGDTVVVDAGAPIPADGVIVEGAGLIDQHILTGESQPVERGVGERVLAATVVCSGRLHVRVETTGAATVAAEIAGMLHRTADFTDKLEAQGQLIADRMALPTLALSAAAFPFVGPHGSVALFNSSLLDSMRLFIPFSMLNYLRRMTRAGVQIKDGRLLQTLANVDTIVFDKTGTLTLGQLRVRRVCPLPGHDADDVLGLAAAAEHRQTHPIALAIVDEAHRRGLVIPAVDETEIEFGFGLSARIGERTVRVGSRRFMATHNVHIPEAPPDPDPDEAREISSLVYVARGETLLGVLELEPTVRPGVERLLQELRGRKYTLCLVSGDHEGPTRALAQSLGFDSHVAGALPGDKARFVTDLQAQGKTVCFVGDGINDCLALTHAAVSVSLDGASAPALDRAQIVLSNLESLPMLFDVAAEYRSNIADIMVSLAIPSALGIGGVLFAGFRVPAMTTLYGASMLAGLTVAMWPHRHDVAAPPPPPTPSHDAVVIDAIAVKAS